MKFGVKKKDAPEVASGGEGFIKYFGKGEKTVRFLEEIDEWTVFYDHFSASRKRSFPCTGDRDTCPGCTSENERESKASRRLLVNCLDPATGYVDLWKVPQSIIPDLERYSDKDSTITGRLYTVVQYKDGDMTKYSVDREDKVSTPVSDYTDKLKDHEEALQESYISVWGEDPADGESPVQEPTKRPKKKPEPEPEEKADPWATPSSDAPEFASFKKEDSDEEEYEDDEEIDESELQKMDSVELKNLFRRVGLRVPKTDDPELLREKLMDQLG